MVITDELVEKALDVLKDPKRIRERAEARAARIHAESNLKVVFARMYSLATGKSVSDRESAARTSPEYLEALQDFRDTIVKDEVGRDTVSAASMIIELYRTQQASMRATRL